jgi:DNA ligase 1
MAKSPMLADHESIHLYPDEIRFPLYALPKIDGIRCVVSVGVANSRKFIPIKNNVIRAVLSLPALDGLDGELTIGPISAENVFNLTTSAVMGNKVKDPQFQFHVFDDFSEPDLPYSQRQVKLRERLPTIVGTLPLIQYVEPTLVESWDELAAFEDRCLTDGFEGVITRAPEFKYKFGRGTKREQGMLKLKRYTDSEAELTGFVELMVNENPDIKDALGHAKRSKAQAGLVPGGTLGTMQCRDCLTGVDFEIGMFKGLSSEDKQEIWNERESYVGRYVKYAHLAHGAIDKPRHSKFLGFRDASDM